MESALHATRHGGLPDTYFYLLTRPPVFFLSLRTSWITHDHAGARAATFFSSRGDADGQGFGGEDIRR
jgi:hypothetical protein